MNGGERKRGTLPLEPLALRQTFDKTPTSALNSTQLEEFNVFRRFAARRTRVFNASVGNVKVFRVDGFRRRRLRFDDATSSGNAERSRSKRSLCVKLSTKR